MLSKKFFSLCMYNNASNQERSIEKMWNWDYRWWKICWVNTRDLEVESDVANWAQNFDKCDLWGKNTDTN